MSNGRELAKLAPKLAAQRELKLNSEGAFSFRNKIINGKMEIAQRGTSFTVTSPSEPYTLDRWKVTNVTDSTLSVTHSADVPEDVGMQYSLRVTASTADASITSAQYAMIHHIIEGYAVRDLVNKPFTLSFWVRSSKTGAHNISFRPSNTGSATEDRTYVAAYNILLANTWEYKTVTVNTGLVVSGSNWNFTNGRGLDIAWAMAVGSAFHTTQGAWQTGNFLSTSNQVNCLDTVGNTFAITGVQLEAGSVATPFEHRPVGVELALCQRYFERHSGPVQYGWMSHINDTWRNWYFKFTVTKRVAPTVVLGTGAAANPQLPSTDGFRCDFNAGNTTTSAYVTDWTASAEL